MHSYLLLLTLASFPTPESFGELLEFLALSYPLETSSYCLEAHYCTVPSHAVSVYVIPCILARFPQSILFGFPFARSVVYYSHVLYSSYIFFGFPFASLSDLP